MAFLEYNPTSSLLHYCSPSGFEGIVESGSIWLTNLQYANDPKELHLISTFDDFALDRSIDPGISADLRAAYGILVSRLTGLREKYGFYSFSLSLQGDKLPMWQEYTSRGQGFCIAFRATAFNDTPLRIQRVQYASPDYLQSVSDRLDALVRPLVGLRIKTNELSLTTLEPISTIVRLYCFASSIKDDTWNHEHEVRLLFSSSTVGDDNLKARFPTGELPDGTPVFSGKPLYRDRGGEALPYYTKPFGRWRNGSFDKSGSIKKIIVGPNNERSIEDITRYLRSLGYRNFGVIRSRCAFR